jgi:carboxypeptidase family protein
MKRTRVLAKKATVYALSLLLTVCSFSSLGQAQVATTSRITGTVSDPQKAVVPNAEVVVKNIETGAEYKTRVGEDGTFTIPSLPVGVYAVVVTAPGFKKTEVTNVKTELGGASTVSITLEVGAATETITVSSGAEILQKESTTVGSVITGRQITELPFTSRDALDLVLNLPGTQTPGRPRTSTVNGLPKAALNISLDGVNIQDNTLRSSDGFFTYIRPRIDAIEEVQISTATPGAESSGQGAVQIKFITKAGTNDYHGGGWWYHRNPVLNSNFYFNKLNRIRDPENPGCDPTVPGCLVETPRARVLLNQFGFKVGGPITPWLKDRAFFFFAYDDYRLPEQQVRTRTILSPDAERGIFRYPGGPAAGVNLLAVAAARGFPGTFDPTIQKIVTDIRSSTSVGAVVDSSDPNVQSFTFTNTGGQKRRFPTLRLDYNVTSKHHIEAIYNYQDFASTVDFLNSADPAYPAPLPQILGSQGSDRFSLVTALRSQLSSTVVNEARFGLTGGTVVFFPEAAPASFESFGGIAPVLSTIISNPYSAATLTPQRRNAPVQQFSDTVSLVKGRHNLNIGASFSRNSLFSQLSGGSQVPTVNFGINTTDPAISVFTNTGSTATLPGADATQLARARFLYAMLTGRVTAVNFNARLDEDTKEYSLLPSTIARQARKEFGLFFQDSFKYRPNLTLNYGLRWEPVLATRHTNEVYTRTTFNGLFGVSGPGNLFAPGVLEGSPTQYFPIKKDDKLFNNDYNNLAPSFGFAWSPSFKGGWLKSLFGDGDKTVIRGGASVSYFTSGLNEFESIYGGNPGLTKLVSARAGIEFTPGSVLFRNGLPPLQPLPTVTFPFSPVLGNGANDFDPNIATPYVTSWTFGIQRELTRDTVFEARYVGNHGTKLLRQYDINEVNIFENGFLQEFIAAQSNLAIAVAAGRAANFRNQGLPGQVNLPIFTGSFGSATSTLFGNATFVNQLQQGQAGATAGLLGNSSANFVFQTNRLAAGLPANLFIANPSVYGGGSFLMTNGADSTYNSLQLELRRRLSHGLLVQGSYVFAKSITDFFASSSASFRQPRTIRNNRLDKGPSPFDIRHAFKLNYIYELPVGPGHKFANFGGAIGKVLEGWQTDGIIRWQSSAPFLLTSGRATVNGSDSGVELVGIDAKGLQDLLKIRKDPLAATRGTVFFLPDDIIENTLRAFGLRPGTPTGRYIAPASTPGKFGSFLYLHQPSFFRADMSIIKKTRITESVNVEFRTEFLNIFNTVQFLVNGPASDAQTQGIGLTFGQTSQAYQDTSTTNDPGGRLIQFVLRVNF